MFKCLFSNITILDFEKPWTFGIPTQILRNMGTKHFKPQKTGVCLRKTGTNQILICRMYAGALKSGVFFFKFMFTIPTGLDRVQPSLWFRVTTTWNCFFIYACTAKLTLFI